MEVCTANEGRDEAWVYRIYSHLTEYSLTVSQSACISPLLLSGGDTTEPPSTLRLDIGEFEAEPFSVSIIAYDEGSFTFTASVLRRNLWICLADWVFM